MQFFSQAGQDEFLFENFFRGRRAGVFLDLGAGDGEQFSHSLFFERFLGWRGLCVESRPEAFARLVEKRTCLCEQARLCPLDAQSGLSGAGGGAERSVPLTRLSALLEKHSLERIDYCSISVPEAAPQLLEELDLQRLRIDVFAIAGEPGAQRIARLLSAGGYEFVAQLGPDCIFKRREVRRLARTSVICAVWHGDPQRHELLAGHAANLANQSVPVEPIYILDGGDEPPESVPGRKVIVSENLSIYQAWNVGLAMVTTPFVMNLNLDDRLAPNAIERLEAVLLGEGAALAGGDWKICYSQQETDAVEPCFPVDRLPFIGSWPPQRGSRTRLGSGTGERKTLGPATLWRMDTHIGAPRYPWRLPDGTLLKVIGDVGWWTLVTQHLKKKAVRLPEIIGNYHSHPSSQAEFRGGAAEEGALMSALGISLV